MYKNSKNLEEFKRIAVQRLQKEVIATLKANFIALIESAVAELPMAETTEEQRRRQLLQQRLGGQDGDFVMKRMGSNNSDAGKSFTHSLNHSNTHSIIHSITGSFTH